MDIVGFIIEVVVGGVFLWLAANVTKVDLSFKEILICVFAASIVAFIPTVGWIASIILLFFLLKKFSSAEIWPDILLMVLVSRLFVFMALFFFVSAE
jgi:hypothetical protein